MRSIIDQIIQQADLFTAKGGVRKIHLSLPPGAPKEGIEDWHWFLTKAARITLEGAGAPRGITYRVIDVETIAQSANLTLSPLTAWDERLDRSRLESGTHGHGITAIHCRFPGMDITLQLNGSARFRRIQKRLAA